MEKFIDLMKNQMESLGFWDENYKSILIKQTERMYTTEVLTEWGISDIIINGDKALFKWYKRHRPLTKDELKDNYGRE